jgi:hypothetical protein
VAAKISRLLSGRFSGNGADGGSAKLKNPRPDIISIDDEDADATHPSEHNSVVVVQHAASISSRQSREKKLQKHNQAMAKIAEKGQYKDEWERLRYERALRSKHNAAFLAPVPYLGMSVHSKIFFATQELVPTMSCFRYPYGFYGVGGCAAYSGGILDGGSASGCAPVSLLDSRLSAMVDFLPRWAYRIGRGGQLFRRRLWLVQCSW